MGTRGRGVRAGHLRGDLVKRSSVRQHNQRRRTAPPHAPPLTPPPPSPYTARPQPKTDHTTGDDGESNPAEAVRERGSWTASPLRRNPDEVHSRAERGNGRAHVHACDATSSPLRMPTVSGAAGTRRR